MSFFILSSILVTVTSSLFFHSISNTSCSSITNLIIKERNNEKSAFSYGEVVSESGKDYGQFYYYADDLPGVALKRNNDTFFVTQNETGGTDVPVDFENISIQTTFVLATQWDFTDNHYGFQLKCGQLENISKTNGIYVTEFLANQLLLFKSETEYDSLIEQSLFYKGKSYKILGVIDTKTISDFNVLIGDNFVVSSYSSNTSIFDKLKYSFIMRGDFTSTYAIVFNIERALKGYPLLKSYYFNWNGESFYLGTIQQNKNDTVNKRNGIVIGISGFALLAILSAYITFLIRSKHKNGMFFPPSFLNSYRPTMYLCFIFSLLIFFVNFVITRAMGYFLLDNVLINVYDPKAFALCLFFCVAFTFITLLLFDKDKNFTDKRLKYSYYEVNV